MSIVFTSYPLLPEQPTQVTYADSYLLKKIDTLFNSRHHIQEQKNKEGTSLFKKSISKCGSPKQVVII